MLSVCSKKRGPRPSLAVALFLSMIVLVPLLAACGSGSTATPFPASPSTLALPTDLLTSGVLTVGSDTTYPPQEFIDPTTNKAVGFDVDLITAMAKLMGLQTHIVPTRFETIIDDLVARRFDVVISAVTITAERQRKVDFVPYFTAGQSLLVRKGNPKNIKSTDDLCGLAVGVQDGTLEQGVLETTSDNCLEQEKPALKIIALQDQTAVIQLLATSRVVATYQDSPVTDYYIKEKPGQFEAGSSVFDPGPEGIAVRKNDPSMLHAIQTAYNQVKAAGSYHQLILKWGLTSEEIAAVDRRLRYA
jgi:polar amino acid transport system substrate-binding protein